MFHNRRHEIRVDFKAAPSFTDVPFPYHHSEETSCPLVWARKEKGKRKREDIEGLQYKQLLSIWDSSSLQLSLLFSSACIQVGKTVPLLVSQEKASCPEIMWTQRFEAVQLSVTSFSHDFHNTLKCRQHRSTALNKKRFFSSPFSPSNSYPDPSFKSHLFSFYRAAQSNYVLAD